jgi:copper chaperone
MMGSFRLGLRFDQSRTLAKENSMYTLNVKQMSCNSCVAKINRALNDFDPQAQISIDKNAAQIKINSHEPVVAICELLIEMGYPASLAP